MGLDSPDYPCPYNRAYIDVTEEAGRETGHLDIFSEGKLLPDPSCRQHRGGSGILKERTPQNTRGSGGPQGHTLPWEGVSHHGVPLHHEHPHSVPPPPALQHL